MIATADPASLPPLRDVIREFRLDARRTLGQHFLLDGNLTGRIARAARDLSSSNDIEVGPGPGGLTRALLAGGAPLVVAIEKDDRCIAALASLADAYPGRLRILAADALDIDVAAVVAPPRKIVANLPYNVATPLLIRWLRQATSLQSMTLMFQKEVADRLVAAPGTSAYGRLSVIAQWLCTVERAFNVDNQAFVPPPKVASTVVLLTPRPHALAPASFAYLEKVTAAAFGQRRKMLRRSLKALRLDPAAIGIDPTKRAEDLPVEAFCALARALEERG